ncbi:MAG: type VI secretion system baseplate subunit TssK [Thermoanaerobaculia bacterium]
MPENPDRTGEDAAGQDRPRARRVIAARDVPPGVQFHEGMLLAPQHFQQLVQRQEALLAYHSALLSPFHWGVRLLTVDSLALMDGLFRVLELEAVMPDGLIAATGDADGRELMVDLSPYQEAMKRGPLTIHLAVAGLRRNLATVGGENARFESVDGEQVADENTGEGELRIPRLRPRLRLLATDEPPARFASFPLARVAYKNDTYELAPDFEPPRLRVTLDSALGKLCQALAHRLREKAFFLADQVRSPSMAMRVPQLLETKGLVASLVSALPGFEALLYSNQAHPFALYGGLCQVVGAVAGIGRSLVPPLLDPYDHHELYRTFDQARAFIAQTLDEGILEHYTAYPFLYREGSFLLPFDPAWVSRTLFLGVRCRDGMAEAEAVGWVEAAKIASRSVMPVLRGHRVTGAARSRSEGEGDLLPGRGVTLWALNADAEFIRPGEVLEIRNLEDPDGRNRPVEILLYVRNQA